MQVRMLVTRRASANGVTTETFLKGRVYDRPEAFVRAHFPDGTYELATVGVTEKVAGQEDASTLATPPTLSKGERRRLRRNGGA